MASINLSRSIFDPAKPNFATDCAIDTQNRQVILRLTPQELAIALVGSDVRCRLLIYGKNPYAYAKVKSDAVAEAIALAEGGGDGDYPELIEARELSNNDDCKALAASELALKSQTQFNANYRSPNPLLRAGQLQPFSDTGGGVSERKILIQQIQRTFVCSTGTADKWDLQVQASYTRINLKETIGQLLDDNARPSKPADIQIPETA